MATGTPPLGQLGAMNPQAAHVWPWLVYLNNANNQQFGQNGETGCDIAMPTHTPITSLTDGIVAGAGYYGGGGVVAIHSVVNGQLRSVYYQHLDLVEVAVGQHVGIGQQIGLSGGQLSGGVHPSTAQFSTGPHIEVGLDAPYGGIWAPIGANVNPIPWLSRLYLFGPVTSVTSWVQQVLGGVFGIPQYGGGSNGAGAVSIAQVPGFLPVAEMVQNAEHWPGFDLTSPIGSVLNGLEAFFLRGVIIVVGCLMLLIVLVNLVKSSNAYFGGLPGELTGEAASMAAVGAL